jgi:hypothetical protein
MYSFAARGDCTVWDEPFYAAYLSATGIDHPMREEVIAAGIADPDEVAKACAEPSDAGIFYQKHMTLHMLPSFPLGWMDSVTSVFLIRHPARVVASYVRKREAPTLADIGFLRQAELFDRVSDRLGHPAPVIDSAEIRANPAESLRKLCTVLGLPFTRRMLSWTVGPKPYDGVWAPHWYNAVHASTGFDEPEGALPDLPSDYARLAEVALPAYERLAEYRL